MIPSAELLERLIDDQAPALFVVGGRVFEGRMEDLHLGVARVAARLYGTRDEHAVLRWRLDEISDLSLMEPAVDEAEEADPMFEQASALTAQAREYGELSLAEQLVRERIPRGDA